MNRTHVDKPIRQVATWSMLQTRVVKIKGTDSFVLIRIDMSQAKIIHISTALDAAGLLAELISAGMDVTEASRTIEQAVEA